MDNRQLISAYDEILSRTSSYNCSMIGELPVWSGFPHAATGSYARTSIL
jgi:hypothetical protein